MYAVALKMPSGYENPPHSHPMDASVVVVKGTFVMGLGDKVDDRKTHENARRDVDAAIQGRLALRVDQERDNPPHLRRWSNRAVFSAPHQSITASRLSLLILWSCRVDLKLEGGPS